MGPICFNLLSIEDGLLCLDLLSIEDGADKFRFI